MPRQRFDLCPSLFNDGRRRHPDIKVGYTLTGKTDFVSALRRAVTVLLVLTGLLGMAAPATAARTVRVGCFPLSGFFEFSADGTVTGYGAEYTEAVASHAGWQLEFVPYDDWDAARCGLSDGQVDLLAPVPYSEESAARFLFSSFPIGTEYGALLGRSASRSLIYEDFSAFDGITVGYTSTLGFLADFLDYEGRNGFKVTLRNYENADALTGALLAGEVDAIVANLMTMTGQMKLLARFGAAPYYIIC